MTRECTAFLQAACTQQFVIVYTAHATAIAVTHAGELAL